MFRKTIYALGALLCISTAGAKDVMTIFDAPGATITFPYSINSKGSVAGYYWTSDGSSHGFVRTPDGAITAFDPPGSTGTVGYSINDKGAIAGYYQGMYPQVHGFMRAADGAITSFDVPGSTNTQAVGVNDSGSVTGSYWDNAGVRHGFVRTTDGAISAFDPPGGLYTSPGCPTSIGDGSAINRKGFIAECFGDSGHVSHGFVCAPDGTITVFDAPGSIATSALNINGLGAIIGSWLDTGYMTYHGFVRTPDGKIKSFRCRGSRATYPLAINDEGSIVGFCYPPTGGHAFLRTRQ